MASTGQGILGNNMFAYCNNTPVIAFDPTGEIAVSTLIFLVSVAAGVGSAGYTAYTTYQAGWETGEILWYTFGAGLGGFLTVYSLGMSAYQMYIQYCTLQGITPVTDIHFGANSQANTTTIPQAANDTLAYIDQTGSPPQGYKGGREFMNDGRGGGQILPSEGMPYHEYDIYPYVKGVSRGVERLVIGSDGSAWFTSDHYKTFISLR